MDLSKLSKKELYELAGREQVPGRSRMTKKELVEALDAMQGRAAKDAVGPAVAPSSGEVQIVSEKAEQAHAAKPDYPIPERYDIDTLVLLPVDPHTEFVYWELSDATLETYARQLNITRKHCRIRVFSREGGATDMLGEQDVDRMGSWYFSFHVPDRLVWSELGIVDDRGTFYPVLTSKRVRMPSDRVSETVDEETWMTVGKNLEKLYALSGLGKERVPGSAGSEEALMRSVIHISSAETARRGE